jgi:HSP20 family protein
MEGTHNEPITAELAAKKDVVAAEEGHLTVDVFQEDNYIVVQSTIAGTDPKNIDISITNDMVTIRGSRHNEFKTKDNDYYHQELYWGNFSRSIILPADIDPDKSKASYKNGVLTIRLPIVEKTRKSR